MAGFLGSGSLLNVQLADSANIPGYMPRNSSGVMPACERMARRVPSGTSPGWLGMVV